MFSFTVTRSCGHQEKVMVEYFDPGKNLKAAVDKLERTESRKPCHECEAEQKEVDKHLASKTVVILTGLTIYILLLVFMSWILTKD